MTLHDLQQMTASQLDTLYRPLQPGPIPAGSTEGKALFFSGTALGNPATLLAGLVWQGKIFEPEGSDKAVLFNRVFGFKAIRAQVFYGPSLLDERESIIIDYRGTSMLFSSIRDEIRQVQPGLYLGKAYMRSWWGSTAVLHFALAE